MKIKVSVSMDEETLRQIEGKLESSVFRNKSHFVEHAVKKLLREHDGN